MVGGETSVQSLAGRRILADISHPSQAWVLRPILSALRERGALVDVFAREKDTLPALLRGFGIPFRVPVRRGRGLPGQFREFVQREALILAAAVRTRPDLLIGCSFHVARAGFASGGTSIVFNEDDAKVVPLVRWLAYPLASRIVTPQCLGFENYGRRHMTYRGSQKLFYLHPDRFRPDPSVRAHVGPGPYAVARLSALDAHHDRNVRGIEVEDILALARGLQGRGRLLVCSENPLVEALSAHALRLPPELMHHALAFAEFFIGDSQSMTVESALLGVPAIRVNDFAGRISILQELETAGLCFGFRPAQGGDAIALALRLSNDPATRSIWSERRQRYVGQCDDPLPWLLAEIDAIFRARHPSTRAVTK
jgi:predicted glycosyltransferase